MPPDRANPSGFWEHHELGELNKRVLRIMGGTLASPPSLPSGWEKSPALTGERERARALLDEIPDGLGMWGWKCPHACLTLPFWRGLTSSTRYVICVRHPFEVAASIMALSRRPTLDRLLALWTHYIASAVANTADAARLFVFYDEYFDEWRRPIARLADFIGSPGATEKESGEILEFIDVDLRHHCSSPRELLGDGDVPSEPVSLYFLLKTLQAREGDGSVGAGLSVAVNAYARQLL